MKKQSKGEAEVLREEKKIKQLGGNSSECIIEKTRKENQRAQKLGRFKDETETNPSSGGTIQPYKTQSFDHLNLGPKPKTDVCIIVEWLVNPL